MRIALIGLIAACGQSAEPPPPAPVPPAVTPPASLGSGTYPDLSSALAAIIPPDARVLAIGELHARTDRAQTRSALDRFAHDAFPALADRVSDLVIETWVQDQRCSAVAADATARVETTMMRPAQTKSEIAELAEGARKRGVQPRAMTISCDDYAKVAPPGQEVDAVAMLTLTTRELTRVTREALAQRDGEPNHRPWVIVYGGALHNDRFPERGTEDWSYAAAIDRATGNKLVEIDLIVPELAVDDAASKRQPWYPLVTSADTRLHLFTRGERSYVVVLPRSS